MSIPYENLMHAVADRAMGVAVWVLRLGGVPASKAPPREPWRGKQKPVAEAPAVRVVSSTVQPAASRYCTFHGVNCVCRPDTTAGDAA